MRRRACGQGLAAAVASILALAATANAEDFTYGVDAGIGETDNVTLVSNHKISQTIAIADVDFSYQEQSRLFEADVKGNFSYLDYLQHAYDRQLMGRLDGSGKFALIPERLTWVLQDDFGQSVLDPFQPTTPNNLENVNYLSTGPDLTLRLGSTEFLNMSARYARTTYGSSPLDSNRLQGSIAWGLQLSARSTLSLNGDTERVLFDNTVLNTDFDRTNAFVRYGLQGSRTDFTADLGATRISQGGESTSGALAKLEFSRKLSSAAKLTVTAGHIFTDASTSFSNLSSGAIGVVGTAPAAVTSDSYTSGYGTVAWDYVRDRTTLGLSGRYERDNYSAEPSLDVDRGGAEFRVGRQLTRSFKAELLGRYYRTDYFHTVLADVEGSPRYDDELIAAVLTWRYGRGLEVKLRAEHDARVTSGYDVGYKDNRAFLTVGYRPTPSNQLPQMDPGG